MYQFIPLHSCDYLCEISIVVNVTTDEGNYQNETEHQTKDELELLHKAGTEPWVRVELVAW